MKTSKVLVSRGDRALVGFGESLLSLNRSLGEASDVAGHQLSLDRRREARELSLHNLFQLAEVSWFLHVSRSLLDCVVDGTAAWYEALYVGHPGRALDGIWHEFALEGSLHPLLYVPGAVGLRVLLGPRCMIRSVGRAHEINGSRGDSLVASAERALSNQERATRDAEAEVARLPDELGRLDVARAETSRQHQQTQKSLVEVRRQLALTKAPSKTDIESANRRCEQQWAAAPTRLKKAESELVKTHEEARKLESDVADFKKWMAAATRSLTTERQKGAEQ
ncbi:hypothetical protein PG997_007489 [Apiospora hydei]|uniref:Uncharacterized protein n=1 Tax=Apiospora hydei TaxID=1337664 RepID=A0ABR1WAX3_9PEZI